MKTIKLLLIISQMLFCVQFINAQAVMSNVSYMYLSRNSQYELKFLLRDTYDIDPKKDTNFEYIMIPSESMLVNGNKVSYKIKKFPNKVDTILYFDFDLKVNDKINRGYFNYLYVVDSIKPIQLLDSNFYMHWFLSSKQGGNLVWIKGLGDSKRGWISDDAGFTPEGAPHLQAICRNNNLVFWYNGYNRFEPDTVKPTCDFDSLFIKYVSAPQINSDAVKIYPNPATEKLFIENNLAKNSNYIITNLLGQEMDKGLLKSEINISNLLNGVYVMKIIDDNNQIQVLKFIKQ